MQDNLKLTLGRQ